MKRIVKKLLLLSMAVALTASLAGCSLLGDNMIADSQTYIQGTLDKYYLGQYNEDYMALIDITEEEAKADYEDWLSQEVEYFCGYSLVESPTDEFKAKVTEFYKEVYSHSKYTVNPASKMDSGAYAVEVDVEPINIMLLVTDEERSATWDAVQDETFADVDTDNMTEAEFAAIWEAAFDAMDAEYADRVLALYQAQLPNLGYEPAQSMVFQLKEVADNTFDLVETDLQKFDEFILAY